MSAIPAHALWLLLGAVIYPLWLAAGAGDVLVHWRDRIEESSGLRESTLHVVQCLQMGAPVLLVLFLDVTAPVFLLCAAFVAVHAWTSWRDTRFADARRHIGPLEQKIHVALDAIPWIALALVAVLRIDALRGLVGADDADWAWRLRRPMWPLALIVSVLLTSFVFGLLPSLLEWRRVCRSDPSRH